MTVDARLTLGEAAAELGVHYQTAYRWVRQGALRAVKVSGVYEVDRSAVSDLAARRAAPSPPPVTRRVRSWDPFVERLWVALRAGEETRVRDLFDDLLSGGVGLADLCDHVLAPALTLVGDAWHRGEVSIALEHRASAICERMLGRWSPTPPGRPRGVAVVCSPPGDEHALPGEMATAVLRERRWKVHHLGVGVPSPAVRELVDAESAELVVLSCTWPAAFPEADALAAQLEAPRRSILLGRPGLTTARLVELTDRI